MSNIYIQEPPTDGKVLLKTTAGDIDIELWSKEAPLACRNFVQLCLEGYYDNVIWHRLVKGFIVQTGDPSGTGLGGESVYGRPFKDEFHSRLRFVRRGLVALANGGMADDNGSQFFITLEGTPELQNKHTIFGKVTGNTLYNILRLGEGEVDRNERPLYPHKILSTEVLSNPFSDIVPREKPKKRVEKTKEEKARSNVKASKNFALLSFGDEAEEEEEEISRVSTAFRGKSKSSHDLLKNDAKLSSVPVVDESELNENGRIEESTAKSDDDYDGDDSESDTRNKRRLSKVKEKLNARKRTLHRNDSNSDDEVEEFTDLIEEERNLKKHKEIEKAKDEFSKIKKQMLKDLRKDQNVAKTVVKEENSVVAEFEEEANKFKEISKKIPKKGQGREEMCWEMLQNFKKRLQSSKKTSEAGSSDDKEPKEKEESTGAGSSSKAAWLAHKMTCTGEDEIVLARDANIRNEEDWYDIYDPRNPINKRRREGV